MSFRAFITGIGGFAGSHLAEALVREQNRVEGTLLPGEPTNNIDHLISHLTLHATDIRSRESLAEAIRKAKPDVVYHLAATTSVSEGERDPQGTMEVNLTGTMHLLEAIRTEAAGARLVYVSSSEVYGKVLPEENPVGEDRPEAPVLLDVRESSELQGNLGQIPGVDNVPITSLTSDLSRLEKYKDMRIAVICRSGGRAHTAAQIMMQQGFEDVSVLAGGMIAWRNAFGYHR